MLKFLTMSLGPALVAFVLVTRVLDPSVAGAIGIGVAIAGFVVAEALAAPGPLLDSKTTRRDIVHALLSSATAQVCLVAAMLALDGLDRHVVSWPVGVQVACIVVGSDFLSYWAHRAQHRVSLLWAPHALHHSPPKLYWLNGLRAHPGDTAWAFAIATLWALVAGFSQEAFAIASVVTTSHLLLQHTRVRFPRFLEAALVTPAWHRVHHDRSAAGQASNLSQIFTIWDRLFGTFRPSTPPPEALGITEEVPDSLLGELRLPWRITPP